MADSGIVHVVAAVPVTRTEYESQAHHALAHGTAFPASPAERQLYYRDDEHKWYQYQNGSWKDLSVGGKYTDAEAVAAMGAKGDANPLHHDRYTHPSGIQCTLTEPDIPAAIARDAEVDAKIAAHHDTLIQDADGDTKIQVEESADEDKIRMDVKGVEAFFLDDAGRLDLAKQPRVTAYKDHIQSIADATFTELELDHEDVDPGNDYDTSGHRFTAPVAGDYLVTCSGAVKNLGDGKKLILYIYKNGVAIGGARTVAGGIDYCGQAAAQIVHMAANDYVEPYIYHNHGSALDCEADRNHASFTVCKLA